MATKTRNPTSDVSFTGTWTGSAGSRYTAVDDHPDSSNPIADGLTHGTSAGEGLFGFSAFDVPAGSTGISVQVLYYAFKNGSAGTKIRARLRCNDATGRDSSSDDNPGNGNANIALFTHDFGATNPKSGAAWTVNDVNGVGANALTAFGTISSDANPSITISSVVLQVTYTPPVTGTLAVTDAAGTAAGAGTVQWTGSLAASEASDSAAGAGTVQWLGSLAASESGADSASLDGQVGAGGDITGDLAVSESAGDSASADGIVQWTGSLASLEASADAAASAGAVEWTGDLAATEGAGDSAAGAGTVQWIGNLSAAEGATDGAAASGAVEWTAALAASEAGADSAAGSGTVQWTGGLAASEAAADAAAAVGSVEWTGDLAVAEAGADAASFDGQVGAGGGDITGDMAAGEAAADGAAGIGVVQWTGSLAASESAADAAAAAGTAQWLGNLAASEAAAADQANFSGYLPASGDMAAAEDQDSAEILGELLAWVEPENRFRFAVTSARHSLPGDEVGHSTWKRPRG